MACTDGKNTYLNIKELPEINDIIGGDYLIVETPNATSILDFANFTITLDNTTFGDVITTNTSNIATLSAQVMTLSNTSVTKTQFNSLNTTVAALTSTTSQDTYAVFSINNYTSAGASLIASSNIASIQLQNTLTSTSSAVRLYFTKVFKDNKYGYSCATLLSTFAGPISLTDLTYNYIDIFVKDKNFNFTTADRVTVRIIGGQLA